MSLYVHKGVYPNLPIKTLSEGAIKFAVVNYDGTTSNSWEIRVRTDDGRGDVYIKALDNYSEIHCSLHKSGMQHVRFRNPISGEKGKWDEWEEPEQQNPPKPSFHLYFPGPWGIRLTEKSRRKTEAIEDIWSDEHLFIKNNSDRLMLVLSFYIVDKALGSKKNPPPGGAILVDVPVKWNKNLCVVACQIEDSAARTTVENLISSENVTKMMNNVVQEKPELLSSEEPLAMLVKIIDGDGIHGLVSFPIVINQKQGAQS